MSEPKPKKRVHVKTFTILGIFVLGGLAAWGSIGAIKPIAPRVVLPGEPVFHIFNFAITNTLLGTLLADIVLLLLAYGAYRFSKSGKLVPEGIYNAFEAIVVFLWDAVSGSANAKWARRIFPIVATIFLLVFTANMVKLLPGFESIGLMEEAHGAYGYKAVELIPGVLWGLDRDHPISEAAAHTEAAAEEHPTAEHADEHAISPDKYYEVVPFLRGSATDMNFPFSLAVITVIITQVYGVWSLGAKYFVKFFNVGALVNGGPFGAINFGVGLLEIILEVAKILSFGFRLFGNVFAGALLLSILGALTAVVVPAGLFLFELFFGIIQAYVFFLLANVFISGALIGHHEGAEH